MKAISLHVGINKVRESLFPSAVELRGPENDALKMSEIAEAKNFNPREVLLGPNATFERVQNAILKAAAELTAGDFFLFTFAGHGSRRTDINGDEQDFQDETILLFDRILVDDYLRRVLWSQFAPGVRIIGVADSCHSGTSLLASTIAPVPTSPTLFPQPGLGDTHTANLELETVDAPPPFDVEPRLKAREGVSGPQSDARRRGRTRVSEQPLINCARPGREDVEPPSLRFREITNDEREKHLIEHPELYTDIKKKLVENKVTTLKATLITLAACLDVQKTPDGEMHGLFTQSLLNVLNGDSPPTNYDALITGVQTEYQRANRDQNPVLKIMGPELDFNARPPFSTTS